MILAAARLVEEKAIRADAIYNLGARLSQPQHAITGEIFQFCEPVQFPSAAGEDTCAPFKAGHSLRLLALAARFRKTGPP
jgi:hypothetical protein